MDRLMTPAQELLTVMNLPKKAFKQILVQKVKWWANIIRVINAVRKNFVFESGWNPLKGILLLRTRILHAWQNDL